MDGLTVDVDFFDLCLVFLALTDANCLALLVTSLPLELPGFLNCEELDPEERFGCWLEWWEDPELDGFFAGVVPVGVVRAGVVVVVVGVVTVTEGVVLLEGWQLALTLDTGGVPGGSICAGGVLGLALTVKVTVWPSSSVAVTWH